MNYLYWVIRFVPNVARGEFTNIGIVCGQDGGDWAVGFDPRFVKGHGNLSSDLRELTSWSGWFRKRIEAHSTVRLNEREFSVRASWIEHLRTRQANSVQFSEASPIDVKSAREGVELLFPHLVEREGTRRRTSVTRRTMRSEIRDLLVHGLDFTEGADLVVRPRVNIGRQRGSFDLARRDSHGEVATNVWAFNVAGLETLERDIQSWNFLVSRLRQDGAQLTVPGQQAIVLSPHALVEVVVDPPSTSRDGEWREDIYEAAMEAWGINQVGVQTLESFESNIQSRAASGFGTVTSRRN